MSSQIVKFAARRAFTTVNVSRTQARGFQSSQTLRDVAAAPARKPVGAFRGGLFGFLTGAVASGAGMYYYVFNEYRVSNSLLTEDIYALQSAVQRLEGYVKSIEDKVQKK
ncbi:hypothetical protein EJ05DRAFT_497332 [Pseudovirgaria hyperparasitica]|uniref:Uncharacterized protein n=1 Tax=Pseudovirgaria hyperparasitica TaxID=470096 RepID=A0A6A6WGK4_9PEZI|nr:uncharacterized protein EJ05DRAFT_497332 [Pseudovirgaria hyperparasitica]KAF2760767.1 hypothetical protein EJ05DRAFT_497332 [Pseudovirgaria hyperparasitica]